MTEEYNQSDCKSDICAECTNRRIFKKWFHKTPCPICGKMISNCGFAYTNHDKMHKRKGEK